MDDLFIALHGCLDGDFFDQVDKLTAQVTTVDAAVIDGDAVAANDRDDDNRDDVDRVVHARHVTTSPRRASTTTTTSSSSPPSSSSSYLRRRGSSSSTTTSPTQSSHRNHYRRGSSSYHHHQQQQLVSPGSPASPSQSLDEYQREQEMEVPDTVASKALYFLHHVDPHKFTNAVIGINAGRCTMVWYG